VWTVCNCLSLMKVRYSAQIGLQETGFHQFELSSGPVMKSVEYLLWLRVAWRTKFSCRS